MYYNVLMNKTIVASLSIFVLVMGLGSNLLYHQAEAKGMPTCWLNVGGTVKAKYLEMLKGTTTSSHIYRLPVDITYCQYHK
jgi:hypothetical protein